jgi:hypothetical protein
VTRAHKQLNDYYECCAYICQLVWELQAVYTAVEVFDGCPATLSTRSFAHAAMIISAQVTLFMQTVHADTAACIYTILPPFFAHLYQTCIVQS